MKDFIKLLSLVTSFSVVGCGSFSINPNEEKIGILGKDYTFEKYKAQNNRPIIVLNVFDYKNKLIDEYNLEINHIYFGKIREKSKKIFLNDIKKNCKYTFRIDNVEYKSIYIKNFRVKHSDSIVIHLYLRESVKFY